MLGGMFLVNGNIFARKVGDGLCVEPDVKVLKWEEGKGKGEEAERGEKSGKKGWREVKMCCAERSENDKERERSEELRVAG